MFHQPTPSSSSSSSSARPMPPTAARISRLRASTATQSPPRPSREPANQITGLPQGSWTAYPGFCAQSGCGFSAAGRRPGAALTAGRTTRANLATSFLLPGQALLSGTVSVLGVPVGFTNPVGVNVCQSGTSTCQTFYVSSGTQFNFVLKAGTYAVNGFYVAAPFDNAVDGPSRSVTLAAGNTRGTSISP